VLAEHPDLPQIIEGMKKLNRLLKKFGSMQAPEGEEEGEEKQQKEDAP